MSKKEVYAFPVILSVDHDDNGAVLVSFPDLENCFADGNSVPEALEEAREALGNVLYWMEKDGHAIPKATDINDIDAPDDAIKSLVAIDMTMVRKEWSTRSVNRTVTLPAWLDEKAKKEQVNFSQVLQQALKETLGITHETSTQIA